MTSQKDELMHREDDERENVERIVRSERGPTDYALKWRCYRLVSWSIVAEGLERMLQLAADAARRELPWENLYVKLDLESRCLRMWFGKHPLPGIIKDDIEVGASMVVAQDPRGGVVVLFFPFESQNMQQSKPKVIWGYFDGPQQLTERTKLLMLRDFLRYGRATSGRMASSPADRRFVESLEERSRAIESKTAMVGLHPWATIALVLGSLATLALFMTWLNTGDGNTWEPWTGMVALLTGWVAVGAQKLGKTGDESRARALAFEGAEKAERDRKLKENRPTDN